MYQQQDVENKKLEEEVSTILRDLGIPTNLSGYHYLITSILLGIEDFNNILNISSKLYPLVKEKHSISLSTLDKALRNAIEISFKKGNKAMIKKIFGYSYSKEKGKATESEFIAAIADTTILNKNNNDLEKKVSTILRNLGVPLNIRGYYYLRTLILLYIKNANCVPNILHGLYTMVAEEYNTSTSRLQRSISYAIELSFVRGNSDLQEQIFNCSSKPSNLKFIVDVSSYLS